MAGIQQNAGSVYNALTSGSKIIGTVIADSDIRIDGVVEGDVKCSGKVVLGEHGRIQGTVECHNAEIMGILDGKIHVKHSLALRASSKTNGEISTQTLMVEPEAVFNGSCIMSKQSVEQTVKYSK